MMIEPQDWEATLQRHPPLQHFHGEGRLTEPDKRLPDGTSVVTIGATLTNMRRHRQGPTILLLGLVVSHHVKSPHPPPAPAPKHPASYHIAPAGEAEGRYEKVWIMSKGAWLIELDVKR